MQRHVRRPTTRYPVAIALLLAAAAIVVLADTPINAAASGVAVMPDKRIKNDWFGSSVDISGDTLVVGAPGHTTANKKGRAYVFERSDGGQWMETATLESPGRPNDRFGRAVAIDGDTLVVGSIGNDSSGSNAGAAFVYERSDGNWSRKQKLVGDDVAAGNLFGVAVAIHADTILVGAARSGATYVFGRIDQAWVQEAKLVGNGADQGDGVAAVSIHKNTAVIGSNLTVVGLVRTGAAYVFVRSAARQGRGATTWSQQQRLTARTPRSEDRYGSAVEVHGRTIVVGARQLDGIGTKGRAFIYRRSGKTWRQEAEVEADPSASTETDYFGAAVATNGKRVVIGAPWDDPEDLSSNGLVYVYRKRAGAWKRADKLGAILPSFFGFDYFGWSTAMSGPTIAVGAYSGVKFRDGRRCSACGAAYVYE